ncbi:hypothetical protein [Streptomyces sp. JJ36]|nr:hypothetical protein [Streptomyces sp. JJ36]
MSGTVAVTGLGESHGTVPAVRGGGLPRPVQAVRRLCREPRPG